MGIRLEGTRCHCGANHFTSRPGGNYLCSSCDRPMSDVGVRPERVPLSTQQRVWHAVGIASLALMVISIVLLVRQFSTPLFIVLLASGPVWIASVICILVERDRIYDALPEPETHKLKIPPSPAAKPEGRTVAGLPLPLNDADYQIANAIDYACWDAGLCELCGKQQYNEQPELECECIGGTRAHNRLVWHADRLIEKRLAENAAELDPVIEIMQDQINYRRRNDP
jgi:hypothetical protein